MIEVQEHPVEAALYCCSATPLKGRLVVAVSGGADSMALLEALRRPDDLGYRDDHGERPSRRLVVAHFDHKLRADSARDAEHVADYAHQHDLQFVLGSGDVARRARATRRSIEEAARDARYEFFAETATRLRIPAVLTAHTRSDVVETVLMRILRGTGRYGLAGIPVRRDIFYRPLTSVTRGDTVDYCAARGVSFVDDPTNADTRFFRNRVRLEILPELRAVFPKIDESLYRMAMYARDEREEFEATADEWYRANVAIEDDGTVTIRMGELRRFDEGTIARLLHAACVRIRMSRDVGLVHYHRLVELTRDDQVGSSADLPGFSARRDHDALVLQCGWRRDGFPAGERPQGGETTGPALQTIPIPGRVRAGDWSLDAEFVSVEEARRAIAQGEAGPDVAYFDANAIGAGLFVRSPRPGDRMRPFGLDGHKKLSDLFIDRKVPRRYRERAVVIEGSAILWVPGLATGEEGRIVAQTQRVVRVRATRA
ncbi:MAG TPA: tRNA lysidine(34) synthetase TilS [Candidatus Krumholzibacteria bacterium]|nr:tRNA lysidine(34) synthetase TilS [Candidatus Krumholzibacteria bacterium]